LLWFGLILAGSSAARAQTPAPAAAPIAAESDRVQKAIADYEAVKNDPDRAAQRRHAAMWLGEIDAPAVTEFLRRELAAVASTAFAATLIEAIGKVVRPALKDDLLAVLRANGTGTSVRAAAAAAIVKMGDRAMDSLLEFASASDETAPVAVRDAAIGALIDSGLDRAHRGLVPLLTRGSDGDQLKLLRRMDAVTGPAPINTARIKLVREATLATAACAWRQLAVHGHERAKELTIDVLERVIQDPPPAVAADLVAGLARVQDPDFYPALLRFGATKGPAVQQALKAAAPAVAKDRALVKWLLTKGLEDARPAAREAAKLLLREAPPEAVQPLVEKLRAELRTKKKKAFETAFGLHDLLKRDPTWTSELAALAAAPDLESRLVGLSMLLELESPAGLGPAQRNLGHKQWELRSLSYRFLMRVRDVSSIALLIARVGQEEGRLAHELDQALFANTGARCFSKREWEAWWEKRERGFALPHVDTVRAGGASSGGQTVAYHDIPVVSSRVCFLVDRSGSMNARIGTDKKFTRLAAAKEQLARVLGALPATHHCNLIVYETDVFPVWKELRPLTDDNRRSLLDTVKKIPIGRGTNIFDAIELAFEDASVDTIYLLTDGQPSMGRVRDPDQIVDEVVRWNRQRQIVIHCIGLGIDSDLLKQLAASSGGTYKFVN
jgi:hypothetical protein